MCVSVFFLADATHPLDIPGPAGAGPWHLFIILIFNFLTYYIFSTFIPLFAFPTVFFPFQLIFNVYKSSIFTPV